MIGRLVALVVFAVAAVGLFYLVQEQQEAPRGRVMLYEPGAYQGAVDPPLDAAQQDELRSRARQQNAL